MSVSESKSIGIITVLQEEAQAVVEILNLNKEKSEYGQRIYYTGELEGEDTIHTVVMTQQYNQGQISIVSAYRDMMDLYHPSVVFLVGIAGGIHPDINYCDVIIGKEIISDELRKETPDKTLIRGSGYRISPHLIPFIQQLQLSTQTRPIRAYSGSPNGDISVFFENILSGNTVIANPLSSVAQWAHQYNDKIYAVEMEAAGLSNALYEDTNNFTSAVCVIRGVSDLADTNKASMQSYRYPAACNAALVLKEFVKSLPVITSSTKAKDLAPLVPAKGPELKELEEITEKYKEKIQNETLLPWVRDTILENVSLRSCAVFPDLFVLPRLNSNSQNVWYPSLIDLKNAYEQHRESIISPNIKECIKLSRNSDIKKDTSALVKRFIKINRDKNIVISGEAGIGKSTLLKHIFLFYNPSHKRNSKTPLFYYLKATEYINSSDPDNVNSNISSLSKQTIQYISYVRSLLNNQNRQDTNQKVIILLDSIDEAYLDDQKGLVDLIETIANLPRNIHVWLGWRQEHFLKNKPYGFEETFSEKITLKEWEEIESKHYVEEYSLLRQNDQIAARYFEAKIDIPGANIAHFSRNPFQLTLLLFLIEYNDLEECDNTREPLGSISLFTLYDRFINLWTEIEKKKSDTDSISNSDEIITILKVVAKEIYYGSKAGKKGCLITDERPVIRDLLHFRCGNEALEFCHRSLAAFLVAKNILDLMKGNNPDEDLEIELHEPLNNDVTQFIRSYPSNNEDEINAMHAKLHRLYHKVSNKEKYDHPQTENDNYLSVKNGIVYLTTRLRNIKGIASEFIIGIHSSETDVRMKVTIAYGAARLGLQDIAKKYAEEYYQDDSELELATRSFSLVYYQDVSQYDLLQKGIYKHALYKYKDDNKVPWKNSRTIRLKNLPSTEKKDIDFRILDVPLLYCFYKSRNWKDVTVYDYENYIDKIAIDESFYQEREVYIFIKNKAEQLKKEYYAALRREGLL